MLISDEYLMGFTLLSWTDKPKLQNLNLKDFLASECGDVNLISPDLMLHRYDNNEIQKYAFSHTAIDLWIGNVIKNNPCLNDLPDTICLPFDKIVIYTPPSLKHNIGPVCLYLEEDMESEGIIMRLSGSKFFLDMRISNKTNLDSEREREVIFNQDTSLFQYDLSVKYIRDWTAALNTKENDENTRILNKNIKSLTVLSRNILLYLACLLNNKTTVIGKSSAKIRVKTKDGIRKIRNFTAISDKKYLKVASDGLPGTVNWSHGFWVSGHWRKLCNGKLGRDRNGKHAVDGRTWIKAYTKNDELGIIKKTRIYNSGIKNTIQSVRI